MLAPVIMVRSAVGFQCWLQSLWSEVQLVFSVIVVRSTVGLQSSRSEVQLVSGVVVVRCTVGLQCHHSQKYSWSPVSSQSEVQLVSSHHVVIEWSKVETEEEGEKKRTAAEVRKMKMDQQKQMIMFLNCVTKTKENHQVNEMSQSSQKIQNFSGL